MDFQTADLRSASIPTLRTRTHIARYTSQRHIQAVRPSYANLIRNPTTNVRDYHLEYNAGVGPVSKLDAIGAAPGISDKQMKKHIRYLARQANNHHFCWLSCDVCYPDLTKERKKEKILIRRMAREIDGMGEHYMVMNEGADAKDEVMWEGWEEDVSGGLAGVVRGIEELGNVDWGLLVDRAVWKKGLRDLNRNVNAESVDESDSEGEGSEWEFCEYAAEFDGWEVLSTL